MRRTGLLVDPRYLEHKTPDYHPERPSRIEVLIEMSNRIEREGIIRIQPRTADKEEILLVHQ
ncbi:MAG: histone deacetylase, partial [Candidatus Latescibacterota bacterium]